MSHRINTLRIEAVANALGLLIEKIVFVGIVILYILLLQIANPKARLRRGEPNRCG